MLSGIEVDLETPEPEMPVIQGTIEDAQFRETLKSNPGSDAPGPPLSDRSIADILEVETHAQRIQPRPRAQSTRESLADGPGYSGECHSHRKSTGLTRNGNVAVKEMSLLSRDSRILARMTLTPTRKAVTCHLPMMLEMPLTTLRYVE